MQKMYFFTMIWLFSGVCGWALSELKRALGLSKSRWPFHRAVLAGLITLIGEAYTILFPIRDPEKEAENYLNHKN